MEVRHEPLGEDAHGVTYWYLDLGPEEHNNLTGNAVSNLLHIMTHLTFKSCPLYQNP